jgi:hypothetical protein
VDLIDEDRELREHLAALGPGALRELQGVLQASQTYIDAIQVTVGNVRALEGIVSG